MTPRFLLIVWLLAACMTGELASATRFLQHQRAAAYRTDAATGVSSDLGLTYSAAQLDILEKLNRADRQHLSRLRQVVVPEQWLPDELGYSAMPTRYESGAPFPKVLVVHLPGQMFGAYEFGTLVRWGPVSSGQRARPTPAGLFPLNWKSLGHTSTVDPDWYMRWYFNFGNEAGLALHAYAMPGRPASHGCVRLLERDAGWLFDWGDEWVLDASGTRVLEAGTPVFIVGAYHFDAPPPWRSLDWLAQPVILPVLPLGRRGT